MIRMDQQLKDGSGVISTSCSWRSRLPIEIYEPIIDAVAGNVSFDWWLNPAELHRVAVDLHSCALVCQYWLPRARRHLYDHIMLDHSPRALKFVTVLPTSPFLGLLVKELTLYGPPNRTSKKPDWNWIYKAMSVLPPLLNNLSVLRLWNLPPLHPTFPIRFSRFTTIERLLIHVLDVDNSFCEIVRFVGRFPQLQHLSIQQCHWRHPKRYSARQQLVLSSLHVDQTVDRRDDMVRWLLSNRLTLASLVELTWRCPTSSPDSLQATWSLRNVLHACSSTLQRLTLDMGVWSDSDQSLGEYKCIYSDACFSYLNDVLEMLRNLRFLYLLGHESPFSSHNLATILSNVPSSLETLRLYISMGWRTAAKTTWEEVDSLLSTSRFAKLRYFELDNEGIDLETMETSLSVYLPRSYSRGLLWGKETSIGPRCE